MAPEEPNIGGRYCYYRKGRHVVVRYIFSLIIKHSPKGTGCTSGAVMHDCLGYLPTFGPAGAGQLALIYYELNCRVLSTINPRRNLTVRFVVHPAKSLTYCVLIFFILSRRKIFNKLNTNEKNYTFSCCYVPFWSFGVCRWLPGEVTRTQTNRNGPYWGFAFWRCQ